jgi:KTSC domain
MSIEWRQPFSSAVAEIGYDEDASEMWVRWSRGTRLSVYSDVSRENFERGVKSPSVGSWLSSEIKGNHKHRYVEG